jgi:hypothetical protein
VTRDLPVSHLARPLALRPPHGVDIQAEVVATSSRGLRRQLARDGLGRDPAAAGSPERTSGLTRIGDTGSS